MQKPVEKPIKFKKNAATLGKTYPVTHIEAVIDGNGKTLPDILELMLSTIPSTSGDIMSYTDSEGNTRYIASTDDPSGIVGGGGMTELTWLELKTLRDNSQLAAGSLYRITDYQCTTTQENTRSAGHQFDIVLLALSENKLAEEGWAMMHIDNIYKVVFDDNEVVSCYVTPIENQANRYYLVNVDTLLGTDITITSDRKDEDNKVITLVGGWTPDVLDTPDLPYNYFQNSNLSAWKVWYCLDNDKSRFAWADDSVDEDSPASITSIGRKGEIYTLYRDTADDLNNLFAWKESVGMQVYTASQTPSVGDTIYDGNGVSTELTVSSFTPAHKGTGLPNGRGVIYRLIDEWNNDCPYDFKNILYLRQLTAGVIDAQGTDTYIPTFCLYDIGNTEYRDASIFAIYYPSDENIIGACYDNIIKMVNTSDIEECYAFKLPNNIILELVETGDTSWQTHSNIIFAKSCSFCAMINSNVIYASEKTYTHIPSGIIFGNKQVVWENIS